MLDALVSWIWEMHGMGYYRFLRAVPSKCKNTRIIDIYIYILNIHVRRNLMYKTLHTHSSLLV
jgi:hypothetical protein